MSSHRMNCRRSGLRPTAEPARPTADPAASGVSVEEEFVPDVDTLARPAGFGTEASTSTQSFSLVDEYEVPAKSLARLREASVSLESNGEAKVSLAGTTYGPFTGATDVTIPLDPGVLTEGAKVRVHHQSTDGNSTTTKATLVVLEV